MSDEQVPDWLIWAVDKLRDDYKDGNFFRSERAAKELLNTIDARGFAIVPKELRAKNETPSMPNDLKPTEVIKEIKRQLDWRGPSGKPQGHIVLTRVQAEALLTPTLMNNAIDQEFEELIELVGTVPPTLTTCDGNVVPADGLVPPVPIMPAPLVQHVTSKELDVLHWLQAEEFSQYGECYGGTLDGLIAKGLAQIHGPGEHQETFIAKDDTATKQKDLMYRAVSLTEAGRKFLEE